ncbi:chlorophyll(ide) b reductase NOL, chloroplastic isoform X3 [Rhododendron vialii]|uniref:chlorophyll(ide) b reductase NOL, chloroplastic isoform X3 n=1 Tax=Rhododendron vialii TaxID=182163 RepID=UPI00265EB5AC|nr:chlorophyll(ide) b reductase NOL, chloroplastic isoform X3 [Rhododendron vialii]
MAILPSVASSLSPPSLSPLCSARSNDDYLISTCICRQSHASSRKPLHLNSRFRLTAISASSNSEAASSSSPPSSSLVSREPMVPPYNVLITGSTKGIGYALAKEFLKAGDNVIICSRSAERVESALQNLRGEFGELHVWGTKCDVRQGDDVKNLVSFAKETLDYIDIWINNAGSNAYSYKPLSEASDDDLIEVVTTNTLGLMICCREAIKMMLNQPRGGHIFNIDGAGSDGRPTPRFAAYGATKRSVVHLTKSLQAELQMQDIKNVIVHNLSPGMVTTDLLMSGANTKQVAESLVPSIRSIPANGSMKPTYIRFLTGLKAYSQIFSRFAFGARRNRYVLED